MSKVKPMIQPNSDSNEDKAGRSRFDVSPRLGKMVKNLNWLGVHSMRKSRAPGAQTNLSQSQLLFSPHQCSGDQFVG
ncbi:hypothetical protein [Sphingopyxis sp.]|uniref:hypothetical protein n=1 Tax=Sphingopyxis sp. TaxID=1908224 RepID=UPI001DABBB98|nr:hypothetical protein [Sphingopyxis sp.]MBW8295708.1 hypothetical protein [Sphingopyxis sp.]